MKTLAFVALVCLVVPSVFSGEHSEALPPPVSDKTYTFMEIEKNKAALKDKVVKLQILTLLGEPSDMLGNGTLRFIAKDASNTATPYGQVAFPKQGLEKVGRQGPMTIYARVHVFTQQADAAALCVAVGTHVAVEGVKATYTW